MEACPGRCCARGGQRGRPGVPKIYVRGSVSTSPPQGAPSVGPHGVSERRMPVGWRDGAAASHPGAAVSVLQMGLSPRCTTASTCPRRADVSGRWPGAPSSAKPGIWNRIDDRL